MTAPAPAPAAAPWSILVFWWGVFLVQTSSGNRDEMSVARKPVALSVSIANSVDSRSEKMPNAAELFSTMQAPFTSLEPGEHSAASERPNRNWPKSLLSTIWRQEKPFERSGTGQCV